VDGDVLGAARTQSAVGVALVSNDILTEIGGQAAADMATSLF
jgi:hypothetical protein